MNKTIISYSHTGNNEALASRLSSAIGAKHIRIKETGKRTMGKIVTDTLFSRTPRINFSTNQVSDGDLVIFVSPVWLGKVAAPIRSCFIQLKDQDFKYGFIALSGGADGPDTNNKLGSELMGVLGREPEFLLDLHKADLLPPGPQPTRDMTMNYQVNENDLLALLKNIKAVLKRTPAIQAYLN